MTVSPQLSSMAARWTMAAEGSLTVTEMGRNGSADLIEQAASESTGAAADVVAACEAARARKKRGVRQSLVIAIQFQAFRRRGKPRPWKSTVGLNPHFSHRKCVVEFTWEKTVSQGK